MVALDILLQPLRLSSNVMSGSVRIIITVMLSNLRLYLRQTEQHHIADDLQTPRADLVESIFFSMPEIVLFGRAAVFEVNDIDRRYAFAEKRHMVVIAYGKWTAGKFF